ncbi:hypothetical protein ACIQI8_16105 [Streptomyces sp. NPDC092369]|uniref:hypothetical protein n=1 Tax=Streptomyces sp. NPDC092369 TaxID=3366015 RepID=UPI00381BBA90
MWSHGRVPGRDDRGDCTSAAGFPNGRDLTHDVIDLGIAQLTQGTVPADGPPARRPSLRLPDL